MAGLFGGLKNFFFGGGSGVGKDDGGGDGGGGGGAQQGNPGDGAARRPAGHAGKRPRSSGRAEPPPQPVLQDALHSPGGVQGLDWYARGLTRDADGELAHESLAEGPGGGLAPAPGGGRAAAGCRVVGVEGGRVNVAARQQRGGGVTGAGTEQQQQPRQAPP